MLLGLWTLVATIFEYGFPIYYGYSTRWFNPVILFLFGMGVALPVSFLEVRITRNFEMFPFVLSLPGFLALPVSGFYVIRAV